MIVRKPKSRLTEFPAMATGAKEQGVSAPEEGKCLPTTAEEIALEMSEPGRNSRVGSRCLTLDDGSRTRGWVKLDVSPHGPPSVKEHALFLRSNGSALS